ncbi:THH1/TOM1/TOM3 domain [Dillenia turbinata]|uniref:THH1/TOM1/TOM3 domain n=1 Tax=Dillenia turbinata TaxID=194707 RepID=A0AAN8UTB9_9MAGN
MEKAPRTIIERHALSRPSKLLLPVNESFLILNLFSKHHQNMNFIYYLLVEILPSSLVLFILRKLPPNAERIQERLLYTRPLPQNHKSPLLSIS